MLNKATDKILLVLLSSNNENANISFTILTRRIKDDTFSYWYLDENNIIKYFIESSLREEKTALTKVINNPEFIKLFESNNISVTCLLEWTQHLKQVRKTIIDTNKFKKAVNGNELVKVSSLKEAIEYVAQNNVAVTNPQEEIEEFRRKDSERESAVISFENSLIIEKLPQENGVYPDDIRYNAETGEYKWLFFNPDGDEGTGEFCELTFGDEDIFEAYHRRLDETDPDNGRTAFIDHIFEVSRQYIVDTYSAQLEGYANDYMNKPDSVERYYTNIGNTGDREKFISSLESILKTNDVIYENLTIHKIIWCTISTREII